MNMQECNEKLSVFQLLDDGYVKLISAWGSDETIIESARMSTNKSFVSWEKDFKLLKYLWDNKHHTPFEMCGLTFEIKAPIFVFREWHRHRTQSYNEMSARYIPLPNDNYIPSKERLIEANKVNTNKQQQSNTLNLMSEDDMDYFLTNLTKFYENTQLLYESFLNKNIPKELARIILPVGRYSKMRASANLRNWLNFLKLRQDSAAQWEIRQYANAIADNYIKTLFPKTYELYTQNVK